MTKYFLHDGNQEQGPFDIEELKLKNLTKDTSVWHEGLENWTTAGELTELNDLIIRKTPPPLFKPQEEVKSTPPKVEQAPPTFTNFGCGNGYTIASRLPFTIDIDKNIFSGFPILNGGAIGDPNANTINGYSTNFVPTITDKVCIPYTFTATNSCGTATYSGFIQNNCIPFNGPLFTLCERTTASIDMVEFGGHLNIYPNPGTSNINIVFTDRYNTLVKECKILNGFDSGIMVNVSALGENTNINCAEWERGLYLIYMQTETGQSFSRLISLY
jgi:hypothetical protein